MDAGPRAGVVDHAPSGAGMTTLLALIAFASNSLLTRLALGAHEIDAATFTFIRLAAGAIVLALVVRTQTGTLAGLRERSVLGPVALLAYALPFSFAYLRIGAATGALEKIVESGPSVTRTIRTG